MPDEPTVITPAAEPEFSIDTYRAERDGKDTPAEPEASAAPEQAPEPAPDSEPGDEQEQPEAHAKGKGGFQRRIDKLTARNAELERRLAGTPAAQPEPVTPTPAAPAGEPRIDDFDSYDAYVAALTDWKVNMRFKARDEAEATAKAKAAADAAVQAFQQKADAARAKYEDFDDVVGDAPPITAVMRDALLESEHGADVMYHLGQNPAEITRISQLSPVAQVRELTRLEAKLAPPPAPEAKPKAITKAPEPIRPVGTSAAPNPTFKADMSFDEYRRWRESGGGR